MIICGSHCQVLDLVAANGNDSVVDCTIPGAGMRWGMCASMLMMLQDDTKTTFVKGTLGAVVKLTHSHLPLQLLLHSEENLYLDCGLAQRSPCSASVPYKATL